MPMNNTDMAVVATEPIERPLTETDAAGRLGLKVATLRAWRHQGRGPAFVRLGRSVRYLPSDLDEFLRANRHGSQTVALE
jgi:predicted DNA-binding transcriptional regulator AlpA